MSEDFINKGLLSTWLNEALTECESNNNAINRFSAVNLLTTLWRIFFDTRGFDDTADYILSTVQRATRTKNKVVNIQTINLMFYLLEEFIIIGQQINVDKIYKSITFCLIENFDDYHIREIISLYLKSTIMKMGLNVNTLIEPLLSH